ncbi:MAG: autotransporter domain-containing protein, partial [Pseudomonadota bacterium]
TTGNDTVNNTGSITGNIDLGGGINAIFNRSGARLTNNPNIALGGGTLTNAGDISPGGDDVVGTTNVTGNFVQTATGRYLADVDFSRLASDLINVSGTADLGGELVVNLQQLENGTSVTILTADAGATLSGISVADTLALNYGIEVDGKDVKLTVDYNFDIPDLSRNEDGVTQYINRALDAGVSDALDPFVVALGRITDPAEFEAAVAALNPETHLSDTTAFYQGVGQFTDKVMSCAVHSGPNAAIAEGQCNWARVTQRRIRQDETNETVGYDQNTSEFAGGIQVAIAPNWRLGGAVGFNTTTTTNNSTYSSDGDTYSGGVVLKYTDGPWLLAGALTVGHQETEGRRQINFPGTPLTAFSDAESTYVGGRLRAAYLIDAGRFYAKPMLDLDITQLHNDGFQETGAGAVSAIADAFDETLYTIRPAIQLGTTIGLGQTRIVRPFLEASVAFHPETDLILPIRFAGASAAADPFQIKSSINETVFGIAGGLDMVAEDGVNFALRYDTEFDEDHVSHSGSFKMSIDF